MEGMTRNEQFALVVMAAALTDVIQRRRDHHGNEPDNTTAAIAVSVALKVTDLPLDYAEGAEQLMDYIYENTCPKPRWLIGIL